MAQNLYRATTLADLGRNLEYEFDEIARHSGNTTRKDNWFGYVLIERNDRQLVEYRIGMNRDVKNRIIDLRHPLSKAAFNTPKIGEEVLYEQEGHRPIEGIFAGYGHLSFDKDGVISKVVWNAKHLKGELLRENGILISSTEQLEPSTHCQGQAFANAPKQIMTILPARTATEMASVSMGMINPSSLLTEEQYKLIVSGSSEPMIIQGRAGSGKTTVALLRLSCVLKDSEEAAKNNPDFKKPRVLVVMHNKALKNYVKSGINQYDISQNCELVINSFHEWARSVIKKMYKADVSNVAKNPTKIVSQFKNSAGIARIIEAYVQSQAQKMDTTIEAELTKIQAYDWIELYRMNSGPYLQKIMKLRKMAASEARSSTDISKKKELKTVEDFFERLQEKGRKYLDDLNKITDRKDWILKACPYLSEQNVEEIQEYQKNLNKKDELDLYDFAILLRLLELKQGGFVHDETTEEFLDFDHMVIDEAQDFGFLQLQVLINAVKSKTGVTIVGDLNQKIRFNHDAVTWEVIAKELGISESKVTKLVVGHRSTLPIMWLGDYVSGVTEPAVSGREGEIPKIYHVSSTQEAIREVADFINNRMSENPYAHICVTTRLSCNLEEYYSLIRHKLKNNTRIDLVNGGDFDFAPGVSLAVTHDIKGLEFDSVLILDADPAGWPDTPENRNLMYVAVTRAQEKVMALAVNEFSPILAPAAFKEFWAPAETCMQHSKKSQLLDKAQLEKAVEVDELDL